jgi:toxin ParE1/3/4
LSEFRLSPQAELDLAEIADYTTDIWGPEQAERYLSSLVSCFARVAISPDLGRRCDFVHSGYRRMEVGKHVVFYRRRQRGIFISRILHHSMLPTRHEMLDDDSS